MKISILHPSYGRPEQAFRTAVNWLSRCVNNVEYVICFAVDDPLFDDYLRYFKKPFRVLTSQRATMVYQMNVAAMFAVGDLFIAISDDFDCPKKWDELLIKALEGKKDFLVKTKDGIQPEIITLPIMDRAYYNRFGYIYHPAYNHFYGDEELYVVGSKLERLIELPIMFEHIHHMAGKAKKDAVNIKNESYFTRDKATFLKRKALNFPA